MAIRSDDEDNDYFIEGEPDGPVFVESKNGRRAMKFSGGIADVEDLLDWAESHGWTGEPIGDESEHARPVVLTNAASGASLTAPADSYVVFENGEFSIDRPTEYEADPHDLAEADDNGPFR